MFTGQKLRKVTKSQTQTLEFISNSMYRLQGTHHGSRQCSLILPALRALLCLMLLYTEAMG